MVKNTYDHLEFALKEKGFWTPADEIRPVKGALMEFPGLEKHCGHECCNPSMRVMGRDITTDEDYVCVKQNCPNDTRQRKGAEGSDCDKCIHNVPARVRTEFRKCDITDHLIGYDFAFVKHMNAVGCRSFEVSQ